MSWSLDEPASTTPGQADDQGNPETALVDAGLAAAQAAARLMPGTLRIRHGARGSFPCTDPAVVAGEHDQRVVELARAGQGIEQQPDVPVEFLHEISIGAAGTLACSFRGWSNRAMSDV